MQTTAVINLEYRRDRRQAMEQQLSRVGWHADFFPAIRPDDAADFPSIGARGCYLSHLSVLKNAWDNGSNQVIILEDDVNFAPNFPEWWARSMSALGTIDWSIFYPGHALDCIPTGLSRLSPSRGVLCAHFVAVRGQAIIKLITALEIILSRPAGHPLGGPMHIDGAYSTIRAQDPSLVTYIHFPALGYQRPSRTDIGDLKWFDRIRPLAPLVSAARMLKAKSRLTRLK